MMENKKYGHFDDTHREYVITDPQTPWPWINYLGNKDFFSLISQTAGGYSFYKDAKFRRLTRYRYNNVPMDNGGRYFYIKEGDTVWNPGWKPCKTPLDSYECRHGMNYTRVTGAKDGVEASVLFFVPLDTWAEVQRLTLTNHSDHERHLKLFSFEEWCLWNAATDMENFQRNFSTGEVEIEGSTIYHKTEYRERRNHYAFYHVNVPVDGYDTDRETFVGLYNEMSSPDAVMEGHSRQSHAHGWSPWCTSKEITPYNEDGSRVQAIQIRTKGYVHTFNDVYYKVVLNDGTVLDWAKNGQTTGTMGTDRYIVAIRVGFWHNTESFPYPQKNLMAGCQYEGVYKDSTGTHYSSWNGQPYTGWAFLDTTQYYFVNGEPARGWQYINGYKYYFYDDGSVATDLEPIMGLPGNYQINYNKATRTMYIMAADGDNGFIIPYKTFNSTCGPDTPDGDFSIYAKYGVKFMHDDIYCKYLNRFYNGFIIHSILFYNTSLELDAITYNYIDDAASGGCLRLLTGNSYWIYKNCGNGTRVHIYYDLWDKGPIEKDAIDYVIPREQVWDPSDPSSAEATAALQQAARAEADVAAQVAAGQKQLTEEEQQLADQLAASSQ